MLLVLSGHVCRWWYMWLSYLHEVVDGLLERGVDELLAVGVQQGLLLTDRQGKVSKSAITTGLSTGRGKEASVLPDLACHLGDLVLWLLLHHLLQLGLRRAPGEAGAVRAASPVQLLRASHRAVPALLHTTQATPHKGE